MNSLFNNKKKCFGFTLTEMLVVVMVISVLAAIAYPLYTKASTKSRAVEAINLLEMVRNKQLQKFARDKAYYASFANIGQLTSNKDKEVIEGQVLKVKDYTLSLNTVHSCMKARYTKGSTDFTFSSSYENTGLGCTGDICTSFGNIIGTANDVCNCGSKACNGGYTLNQDTCQCQCLLGCDVSGSCFAPYGGGNTRNCSTGCGTESSSSSCTGEVWSGTCWTPAQNQPTTQSCGNSGTQTRTCTPSCGGGTCGAWGACTGQSCPSSTKPAASQACGNCGTQTRTVTCNDATGAWSTGAWGTCSGQGVCAVGATQTCNGTGTQTCSSTCAWGTCNVTNCDPATKPASSEPCGNCGTQNYIVTCNTSTGQWQRTAQSNCTGQGVCAVGATQTCNGTGTQTCSSTCTWGACNVVDCNPATKPAASQACGNCNTGTQTRSVDCEKATGTWLTTAWGACTGGGTCAPGATQSCGSGGSQTCSSSCAWGTCVVPVTAVVVNTTAIVYPSTSGGSSAGSASYVLCQPGTGFWRNSNQINPNDCRSRSTQSECYNDYLASGTQDEYVCTELSMSNCSGTNYQSICNANGKGYKCKISASGDFNSAWICMCEWYNGGYYGGNYCDAASGLSCTNMYLTGEGTGSYLSCQ